MRPENKILQGMRDALAFARGDRSKARISNCRPYTLWEPHEGEGWVAYLHQMPPADQAVEFHSIFAAAPFFGRSASFPPEFNVYGLYWRHY